MAKHLLKFDTAAEYSAATIVPPAVSWVVSDNEIKNNNYVPTEPYVEIGGVKWAKMNVGAETETDYGLYFQWADISGYTADQVGVAKQFSWADYKYCMGDDSFMTKYVGQGSKTVLDASDDAATANWGSDWRMPTRDEVVALGNAVNTAWTADYQGSGVSGLMLTDKEDSSKVLFFPAAGSAHNGSMHNVGINSLYWSSSLNKNSDNSAYGFMRIPDGVYWNTYQPRDCGYTVRPVHI